MTINELYLVDYDNNCQSYVRDEWLDPSLSSVNGWSSWSKPKNEIAVVIFKRCETTATDTAATAEATTAVNVQHIDRGCVQLYVVKSLTATVQAADVCSLPLVRQPYLLMCMHCYTKCYIL
eukprot:11444-Heterococcus_DN1.PRE.2